MPTCIRAKRPADSGNAWPDDGDNLHGQDFRSAKRTGDGLARADRCGAATRKRPNVDLLGIVGTEPIQPLGLDTLLISRVADGSYQAAGTGALAEFAEPASDRQLKSQASQIVTSGATHIITNGATHES